jgi:hypothetical protein
MSARSWTAGHPFDAGMTVPVFDRCLETVSQAHPPTKVSLLEVFVWFPTSEIMVLSQQALQVGTRVMALDSQSEVGFLSR